jgi:hypothetical protein
VSHWKISLSDIAPVLGDHTYESLAHKGEAITTATIATYAYDQIDQARAELNAVSKGTSYEHLDCRPQLARSTSDFGANLRLRTPEV